METRPGSYLATLRHYCCYYFFFFFFCCCRCLYAVGVTIFGHWPIGHGWQKSPNHWEILLVDVACQRLPIRQLYPWSWLRGSVIYLSSQVAEERSTHRDRRPI